MQLRVASPKDLAAGALFIAVAVLFAALASGYEFGTSRKMGPGYFPLALAGLLGLLGLVLVVRSLRSADAAGWAIGRGAIGRVTWRALTLVVIGPLIFGLTVRGLGMIPAVAIVVLVSAAASPQSRRAEAALLAFGLGAFSWAVFIEGLGLPLPLIGRWLGGH